MSSSFRCRRSGGGGMRLTAFMVNTICRPFNALFALADRDVCRWAQDTDEDDT